MQKNTFLLFQIIVLPMWAAQKEQAYATERLFMAGKWNVEAALNWPFPVQPTIDVDSLEVHDGVSRTVEPLVSLRKNLERTGLADLGPLWSEVREGSELWNPCSYTWWNDSPDSLEDKLRFLAKAAKPMIAICECIECVYLIESQILKNKDSSQKDLWFINLIIDARLVLRRGLDHLKVRLCLPSSAKVEGGLFFKCEENAEQASLGVPGYEGLWSRFLAEKYRLLCAQIVNNLVAPVEGHSLHILRDALGGECDPLRHILARVLGIFYYHDLAPLLRRLASFGHLHFDTVDGAWSQWMKQINGLYESLDPAMCFKGEAYHPMKFVDKEFRYNAFEPQRGETCDRGEARTWEELLEPLQDLNSLNRFEALCLQKALDARWPDKYPEEVAANLRALPYADKIAIR